MFNEIEIKENGIFSKYYFFSMLIFISMIVFYFFKIIIKIVSVLLMILLCFMIADHLNVKKFNIENIKASKKKFNEKEWKNHIKRDMMLKDLFQNYKSVLKNEENRKRILGNEEDLGIGNFISLLEEYEYRTQGYKIFEEGNLLKKKVFLVFYRKKCAIVEEKYIFSMMFPLPNNIYDC